MLCLSGFELCSRWVPLTNSYYDGSSFSISQPRKTLSLSHKVETR